jgi:hypothetical protein
MSIDWNKTKFRSSSWGNLLTEPRTKSEGALSVTCQKELIKIYNQEKYGRKKDITTNKMDKGKIAEPDSINLASIVESELFYKNEEPKENEWFTGHPDIIHEDRVYDIKSSWELDSFMPKLIEEPDKGYVAQLNVYYSLTGAQGGAIIYCLVDCPPGILMQEKQRLLYSMDVISELSPDYVKAAAELEKLLTFQDIDPRERVIKKIVPRDEELIQKMKDKVPILREWLYNFEKKHMSMYCKDVV